MITFVIAVSSMAILGLSGCADPKLPMDEGNIQAAEVPQMLNVYARYARSNGKTVETTEGVQEVKKLIMINRPQRPMTHTEVLKLIEQDLREQAGVVVIHRDSKNIVFGLSGDSDQRAVSWPSPR